MFQAGIVTPVLPQPICLDPQDADRVTVTRWALRTLSVMPPRGSVCVCQGHMGASVPTVNPTTGVFLSANPASAMGTANIVTHVRACAWTAGATPQATSVRAVRVVTMAMLCWALLSHVVPVCALTDPEVAGSLLTAVTKIRTLITWSASVTRATKDLGVMNALLVIMVTLRCRAGGAVRVSVTEILTRRTLIPAMPALVSVSNACSTPMGMLASIVVVVTMEMPFHRIASSVCAIPWALLDTAVPTVCAIVTGLAGSAIAYLG